MTKPAILYHTQRIPYPPVKGERILSYHVLRYLSRHYRVFVGTFIDDPVDRAEIPRLRELVEELHVDEINKPWAFAATVPRWLLGEPVSFALFRSGRLSAWVDSVKLAHQPVAVIAVSSNIATYAVENFNQAAGIAPPRLFHFVDVDSEKFVAYGDDAQGLKRWFWREEARRVRREERRLAAAADAVAFVSDEEGALFRAVAPEVSDKIKTLPNGVDTDTFSPDRRYVKPMETTGPVMVFTGAMDYFPNIQAVTWFVREVFPGVRAAVPTAEFFIVGSKPTPEVTRLGQVGGVTVTGRVDSVAAYLAHAQLAVAPLQIARGIQNKVLEALAMGMATVVSPGALTGIAATDGKHLVVAQAAEAWIKTIVALLGDNERRKVLGQAARALIEAQYTWEAQYAKLARLLPPLATDPD